MHVFTCVQINSSASCLPPPHSPPATLQDCRQAERQPGQAAQQAAAAQERCTLHFAMQLHRPPCHALLLRRLSALQSNSLTQQHCIDITVHLAFVQCTPCLPMHSAMHSNRLKPASTQLRPHSALHHTCIALHTLAHDTALTPTLQRNAPRCNSLSACVCSGGHCTRACGSVAGVGGVRGRGWV